MVWFVVLVLGVLGIYGYAVALHKAKAGEITVYKNWWDFGLAIIWPVCLLLGLVFLEGGMIQSEKQPVLRLLAMSFLALFLASAGKLVVGAFTLNKKGAWLALHARFFGSIFAIGIIGLVWQERSAESGRRQGLVAQLLWLVIYCWIFKTCVLPLVGDNGNAKSDVKPDDSDETDRPHDATASIAIAPRRRKGKAKRSAEKTVAASR